MEYKFLKVSKRYMQYIIDEANGKTFWRDAKREEMKKPKQVIQIHDGNIEELVDFEQFTGRII